MCTHKWTKCVQSSLLFLSAISLQILHKFQENLHPQRLKANQLTPANALTRRLTWLTDDYAWIFPLDVADVIVVMVTRLNRCSWHVTSCICNRSIQNSEQTAEYFTLRRNTNFESRRHSDSADHRQSGQYRHLLVVTFLFSLYSLSIIATQFSTLFQKYNMQRDPIRPHNETDCCFLYQGPPPPLSQISRKLVHNFSGNPADRQVNQTDKLSNKLGQKQNETFLAKTKKCPRQSDLNQLNGPRKITPCNYATGKPAIEVARTTWVQITRQPTKNTLRGTVYS